MYPIAYLHNLKPMRKTQKARNYGSQNFRRKSALKRLEEQLKKLETILVTRVKVGNKWEEREIPQGAEADKKRILKEIEILKSRI